MPKNKYENLKIVRIMCGLGNQMFQYAFGQVLGNDTKYDLSWFRKPKKKGTTQRTYELDMWNCHPQICSSDELQFYKKKNILLSLLGIKQKKNVIYEEPSNQYNKNLICSKQGYFEGYFQVAAYYDKIRPQLLKEFTPSQELTSEYSKILEQIKSVTAVSIHIRRGDYVNLQHKHPLCNKEYYQKAIEYICSKVKKPTFFIFSDDPKWVEENFEIKQKHIIVDVENTSGFSEIWCMKHCKHNIIANSSFSWWGAWLNENKSKIVIAPKQWFSTGSQTDIIPKNWIKLPSF